MLQNLSIVWGCVLLLVVCFAAVKDLKSFTIPHIFPGIVIILWVVALPFAFTDFMSPADIFSSIISSAIAFSLGFILFMLRMMGGGDVKLFAAVALWFTPNSLMQLALLMFTLGLIYTLGYAVWYYCVRRKSIVGKIESRRESYQHIKRSKIPYGPAIAIGLGAYLAIFSA